MHTKKKLLAADCGAIIENINEKDENELTRTVQNNFFLTKMNFFTLKNNLYEIETNEGRLRQFYSWNQFTIYKDVFNQANEVPLL
jgi:hypothetical protein